MKPIKQTVYTNVQNETISNDTFSIVKPSDKSFVQFVEKKEGYFFTPEQLNQYTQTVIKQALETAAEKVKMYDINENCHYKNEEENFPEEYIIDTQSITNTFEETYKKFEV